MQDCPRDCKIHPSVIKPYPPECYLGIGANRVFAWWLTKETTVITAGNDDNSR